MPNAKAENVAIVSDSYFNTTNYERTIYKNLQKSVFC